MDSAEVIEGYLIRSGCQYESIGEGMWVVHDEFQQVDNIVIRYEPPLVVFRVKLLHAPEAPAARAALFEELLQLNATDMVSGAYGLEGDNVIATETLQSENLDFNEFQAAIEGMTLAIAGHYEQLKSYHQAAGVTAATGTND